MLMIRLARVGRKHQPHYRVVVAEQRSKLGGPPVEDVGFYNPSTKEADIKKERVAYWLKMGARSSATAHNLFVRKGILAAPKCAIKIRVKKTVDAAAAAKKEAPGAAATSAATPAAG